MHQGEVISIGDHEKDALQGIGRSYYSDGTVEDGVFKQGELNGIGVRYNRADHRYILGEHNQDNEEFERGFGFPQK
jgi:antitoxin component YwqK of YwqJK toxin-antitoxin module